MTYLGLALSFALGVAFWDWLLNGAARFWDD